MVFRTEIGKDISRAKQLLDNEEIVAIPTETVYGLAANAFSEIAINKVYKAKNRPSSNPLIVHVGNKEAIYELASEVNIKAELLIEKFMPGPLTILLPKSQLVPEIVTSGLPHIAIRMPAHTVALELLNSLNYPLAAPSANPFGYISPTTANHVFCQMKSKIPYILDGGHCKAGIESTIIGFKNNIPVLHRMGSITVEEIEQIVGEVVLNSEHKVTMAPGNLEKHYSPRTPVILSIDLSEIIDKFSDKYIGLITYDSYCPDLPEVQQIMLGKSTNLYEIAHNLYAAMHKMDLSGFDFIVIKKLPDEGIGKSINDRLNRASKS
ncbi:MAG: threonylcarbamoyl-AMP synthase [Taibaiella sp.]|nr:threonylcarbamoyl-AMP synthase [Taibaiella sp.]